MALEARDTDTRGRIVRQAEEFFRLYGYQKTTVADIAKALRMSPANVYRFFDSKKAINEEVAVVLMGEVEEVLAGIARSDLPPPERLVRLLNTMHEMNASRYTADRKMHEMVEVALDESWSVVASHLERVNGLIAGIIADGVRSGDFRVKDPLVAARCAQAAFVKFCHPRLISECGGLELAPETETMTQFILAALGFAGAGV